MKSVVDIVSVRGNILEIVMLSDPLLNDYGAARIVTLLAREFSKKYNVSVVSIKISNLMRKKLESYGVKTIDFNTRLHFKESSIAWLESCIRQALFASNSRKLKQRIALDQCKLLKFTCIYGVPSDVAYGLGFVSSTLNAIVNVFAWRYKLAYKLMKPLIGYIDRELIANTDGSSRILLASTRYCANLYAEYGIRVHDVIYPPIDCKTYKPATSNPQADYVLSYMGKESKFPVIKKVADMGIKMKTFGAKLSYIPTYLQKHPSIEHLGHVTDEELIDLYSNAHYTFFAFTEENFGYIPLESMACGTPVLTYAWQGPGETVVDGVTGWLARNNEEMMRLAGRLEKDEYPNYIRKECRRHSLNFDVRHIVKKWMRYVEGTNDV